MRLPPTVGVEDRSLALPEYERETRSSQQASLGGSGGVGSVAGIGVPGSRIGAGGGSPSGGTGKGFGSGC